MSCSKDNNNIDVRLAFNKSFNNLYNYAKLRNNVKLVYIDWAYNFNCVFISCLL